MEQILKDLYLFKDRFHTENNLKRSQFPYPAPVIIAVVRCLLFMIRSKYDSTCCRMCLPVCLSVSDCEPLIASFFSMRPAQVIRVDLVNVSQRTFANVTCSTAE